MGLSALNPGYCPVVPDIGPWSLRSTSLRCRFRSRIPGFVPPEPGLVVPAGSMDNCTRSIIVRARWALSTSSYRSPSAVTRSRWYWTVSVLVVPDVHSLDKLFRRDCHVSTFVFLRPKPIPRWDVHFGEIDDDRKDSTAPRVTFRPQLGGHRQCGLAICTFHLGFSLEPVSNVAIRTHQPAPPAPDPRCVLWVSLTFREDNWNC